MAFLTCNFSSETLGMDTSVNVVLPEGVSGKFKTLYLLHGLSDNYSNWVRRSSIERYACEKGIAVIMPDGGRSFYTDMAYGPRYYTYIAQELPKICRSFFNISDNRDDTFVAGLSMGGYGAFKLALKNPDKYCGAASLSGVLDIEAAMKRNASWKDEAILILGENPSLENSSENLFYLLKELDKTHCKKPRLYQACGTEDFLYEENVSFRRVVATSDIEHFYEEGPGDHSWEFWDTYIRKAIDFLIK